tara:strand:- start:83 stop:865 length:783 start_codon:yes stop_codon:yes gene_type:complete
MAYDKEYHKEYGKKNREKLNEYAREHYKNNKEYYKEYQKEYLKNNKEKIAKAWKKYYNNNKENIRKQQRIQYKNRQLKLWPRELINKIINLYEADKTLKEISLITDKKVTSIRGKLIEYKIYKKSLHALTTKEWKEYRMKYSERKPEVRAINSARKRARDKNLPIDIDIKYLRDIWPENNKCPALNIKLKQGRKGISHDASPSLDRIIPSKGYVKGNVQWISKLANQIKSSATPDQVIQVGLYLKKVTEDLNNGTQQSNI